MNFAVLFSLLVLWFSNEAGFWIDVPFVEQGTNGCGPACAAMILGYWKDHLPAELGSTDEGRHKEELAFQSGEGTKGSELKALLEEKGFQVFLFSGEWSDLTDHIRKGRPVIVALAGGREDIPLHFVVVVGFDEEQQLILLHDPARRMRLKVERDRFEALWSESDFWSLLALPSQ